MPAFWLMKTINYENCPPVYARRPGQLSAGISHTACTCSLFGAITFCELHWCEIRSGERSMGQIARRNLNSPCARLTSMYLWQWYAVIIYLPNRPPARPCVCCYYYYFGEQHGVLCGMHHFIVFDKNTNELDIIVKIHTDEHNAPFAHNEPWNYLIAPLAITVSPGSFAQKWN